MKLLLIGPPGSGKGTQAKFILDKYSLFYIPVGNILRDMSLINNEIGKKIKYSLERGKFISDELIINIIKDYMLKNDIKNNFLIDGFPRNINQALNMDKSEIYIDTVIEFYISDDIIIERLLGRYIHIPSGRVYHNILNPPVNKGFDDITGEPLSVREDDNINTIKNRLNIYNNNLKDLRNYFFKKKLNNDIKYYLINANLNINLINNLISKLLENNI